MRVATTWLLIVVNLALTVALVLSFGLRGGRFTAPWDGPTLVTIVLAAATLVLAAVAIGVALITIWGYTTLREHAANIAQKAASETAEQVATKTLVGLAARYGLLGLGAADESESIVDAYRGEEP